MKNYEEWLNEFCNAAAAYVDKVAPDRSIDDKRLIMNAYKAGAEKIIAIVNK